MSSNLKPIKLWGVGSANPPKVHMLLAELGLPFEGIPIAYADLKKPAFLAINPNGRIPAIQDPNTDITVWESAAILQYLVDKYDAEHRLSFEFGSKEYYEVTEWLFFQASGQGPYYGQLAWFTKFHHEQLPSAKERYKKEVQRVTGVLESHLHKQKEKFAKAGGDGPWLVGNKYSVADIAWIAWQQIILMVVEDAWNPKEFPLVQEWQEKMKARKAIGDVMKTLPKGH
ncbi:glutathione S-transferas-like protein [Lophiotrema nucula]|uniref:Glutathione S-transferas-like protein n=1 Tax=Lophiotrema nucula TaxID=690887 RepID=A0A6A5ZUH2_9PLEO|nr:glutathione S-transferas-like protein [Lophiotrema nucula]